VPRVSVRLLESDYSKLDRLKKTIRVNETSDAIRFCITFTTAFLDRFIYSGQGTKAFDAAVREALERVYLRR